MPSPGAQPVLFAEPGARGRAVCYGPVLCAIVLIIEIVAGWPVHLLILVVFAVLLAGIAAVQVTAARLHVSVELTPVSLRSGVETIALASIAEVLPERDAADRRELPWETARSLGELSEVPRRRTAIGLRLTDGELVRAWAKDAEGLRAALTAALGPTTSSGKEDTGV